jgi:hypothetical protein
VAVLKPGVEHVLIGDARSRDVNQQRARLHQSKATGVDQSCLHRHENESTGHQERLKTAAPVAGDRGFESISLQRRVRRNLRPDCNFVPITTHPAYDGDSAGDLLAPVYGWFTEGFDTADLKEAKGLFDELT